MNDDTLFLFMNAPWAEIVGFSRGISTKSRWPESRLSSFASIRGNWIQSVSSRHLRNGTTRRASMETSAILANPDNGLDPSRDLDRYALGRFNHVGVSESLVIASRSADVLASAIDVAAGKGESLAESQVFADVAAAVEGMHGFMILNGSLLGSPIVNPGVLEDGEAIPPARLLLGGIAANEDGQMTSLIADLGNPQVAEAAVPVVQDRIDSLTSPVSKRPYAEDLEGYKVDVVKGTGLVRVTVPNDTFAMRWMRYIYAGDLLFLATEGVS